MLIISDNFTFSMSQRWGLRVSLVISRTDWRIGIENILVKMSASVTVVLLLYCCSEGIFLGCFSAFGSLTWQTALCRVIFGQKPPLGQDSLLRGCAGVLCLVPCHSGVHYWCPSNPRDCHSCLATLRRGGGGGLSDAVAP